MRRRSKVVRVVERTVECLAAVPLLGAVETGEGHQKRGTPLLVTQCQKLKSRNAYDPRYFFSSSKVPSLRITLKGLGKLRQKPRQEHYQAHVILGYVD
jgi:hypothetical protein